MYETEFQYIKAVMPMFAGASDADILDQCSGAELMGYAENKEVLDSTAPSVYSDMCGIWNSIGEDANAKMANTLFDNTYLLPLSNSYSSTKLNEDKPVEMTTERQEVVMNTAALLTKTMTVEFYPDTAKFLDPDSAYVIMDEFVEVAKTLDGSILQIEGNINSRNDTQAGQQLSYERANAVAKYFISCGIDPNRLVVVGNGNHNMLVDPGAADATPNRRTDVFFKILED